MSNYNEYSESESLQIDGSTIQEIWERYSEIFFKRNIFVKRIDTNGDYESSYININDLVSEELKTENVCSDISIGIPNNTYALGTILVSNATFNFVNPLGEFSDEDNIHSIFNNYVRHNSLIKVIDSFIDKSESLDSMAEITTTTFEGFINDKLTITSEEDVEIISATDILGTLLKSVTYGELITPPTSTDLKNLVYEIMNQSPFTDFLTINLSNIIPGYDITSLTLAQINNDDTILDILENLSTGHSVFYAKDGIFFYRSNTVDPSVTITLDESPERKIKFSRISNGANIVKDKLFWQNQTEQYIAPDKIYDESFTFNIPAVTNGTQRQNLLNHVGAITSVAKTNFDLVIPFLPILFILNKIKILKQGAYQDGGWILDVSKLDEIIFSSPLSSFKISLLEEWAIKKINHKNNLTTVLTLEKSN